MRVRIEAVISTAGNNEEYVGRHLGLSLLGRPLQRMVVTFEEEMSDEEYYGLVPLSGPFSADICKELRFGNTCLPVYSFRVHQIND
jgi:hypothetical protein